MLSSTSPAHPSIPYDTQHTFPSYPELDSGSLQQPQAKKRKTERACDACRRKKTRCDGPTAVNNVCTNCIQSKKACTYVEGSKPRGPPKAYVTGLEDRVEELEALLAQIRPGVDFSEQLGPPIVRGSWKTPDDVKQEPQEAARNASLSRSQASTPPRSETPTVGAAPLPPLAIPFHSRDGTTPVSRPVTHRTTHLEFKPPQTLKNKKSRISPDFQASSPSGSPAAARHQADLTTYRSPSCTSNSDGEDVSVPSSDSDSENIDIVETSASGRYRFNLDMNEMPGDESCVNRILFHGRSSTAGLVEATRRFKHLHLQETMKMDTRDDHAPNEEEPTLKDVNVSKLEGPGNDRVAMTRRLLYWKTSPWEHDFQKLSSASPLEAIPHLLAKFPSPNLCRTLIDLYFTHTNNFFPLLHRPTFERQWKERLYEKNVWFTAVCFQIFAIASRWCEDESVLGESQPGTQGSSPGTKDWTRAGWHFHAAGADIHKSARSLIYPATLFEIQSYSLIGTFLRGTAYAPTAWIVVSIGLRKAYDVGAHRKGLYQSTPNVNDELWKRAFWLLLTFDRIGAVSLGRSLSVGEEDFDLDLPLEVDDEYWSGPNAWMQPEGIPSIITGFNHFLRLTQILSFTVKTVYAVDREKLFRGLVEGDWRLETVSQLNTAMEVWLNNMPPHLKWSEDIADPFFFAQSAMLHTNYHLAMMQIYRPFIPSPPMFHPSSPGEREPTPPPASPPTPFPALAICVTAARRCAKVVEAQLSKGSWDYVLIPAFIHALCIPAATLVLALWDLKAQQKVLVKIQSAGIIDTDTDTKPDLDRSSPQSETHSEGLLIALEQKMRQLISEVTMLIDGLECVRPRWECVHSVLRDLKESLPKEEDLQIKLGSLKPPTTFSQMSFQDLRRKREQEQQEAKSRRKQESNPKTSDLATIKSGIEDSYVPLTLWPPRENSISSVSSQPTLVSGAEVVRLMQQHELHTFGEDEFEGVPREASIQLPRLPYHMSSAPRRREGATAGDFQQNTNHPLHCQCTGCVPGESGLHTEHSHHRPLSTRLYPYGHSNPPSLASFSFNASPPFISSSMRRTADVNTPTDEHFPNRQNQRSLYPGNAHKEYAIHAPVSFRGQSSLAPDDQMQPLQPSAHQPDLPRFDSRSHPSTLPPSGGYSPGAVGLSRSGQGTQLWKTGNGGMQGGSWGLSSNSAFAYSNWESSPPHYTDQQAFPEDHRFQSHHPSGDTRYHAYSPSRRGPSRDCDPPFATYGS